MIRIFLYIVVVILAAWLITMLSGLSGYAVIELEGQRLDIATNLLLGLAIFGLIAFFFGGTIVSWIYGLPKRVRRRSREGRRSRGMTALARGLEAVAAGDAADAQRHARIATKHLEEPALTRLLTAQAAQLAGDTVTAQSSYSAMLEAPETEFLGLRGLYIHALQNGDREEARSYAERAFHLRPGTAWAFESVLSLSLERGAWGDALEAIRLGRQHEIAGGDEYRRMEAALLTAQAHGAFDSNDETTASKDAEQALKKAKTLTPAAVIAARSEAAQGHRSKAAKILGDAWEARPHPGLAAALRRVFDHERDEKIEGRLVKLAERRPDDFESKLLLAEVQLEGKEPAAAQETLEPLLVGRPMRRVLALAARIAEARGHEGAAAAWRRKAEAAPPEFIPGQDGSFNYTTEGWRRLIREYAEHERLTPPPLEVEVPELAADEVQALLAPPVEPGPVEEPEATDEAVVDQDTQEEPQTAADGDAEVGEETIGDNEDGDAEEEPAIVRSA